VNSGTIVSALLSFLTWRVGAPCSISERVDIPSVRRTIGFANAWRAVCIFWTTKVVLPRHDTPRKSCARGGR
jgi:hypothetical protein